MKPCFIEKYRNAVLLIVTALFFIVLAGCTELERQGLSPIPQNSPGAWEVNPYM